jgi:transcriptional regulator with XRE-family HTH domain
MSTIKELRLEARLSIAALARLADVDRNTVERAEEGKPVQDAKAYAIVAALSGRLGRKIDFKQVDGLHIL